MYSERQRPDLQDQSFYENDFPQEMRGSISPKVYGIIFVCNDLNNKGRPVIGVLKDRRRPVVVM
jgi:hypothetical protein